MLKSQQHHVHTLGRLLPFLLVLLQQQTSFTTAQLDIVFLLDTTLTFEQDLSRLQAVIDTIVNSTEGLSGTDSLAHYGLAVFEDYPLLPYGRPAADGKRADVAYRRVVNLTNNTDTFTNAVKGLNVGHGNDKRESQLVALRQVLLGTGQTGTGTTIAAGQRMNFRANARKVIVMWTDSEYNSPARTSTYPGPTFATVRSNLQLSTVNPPYHFVGLDRGGAATTDLRSLANVTNSFAVGTVDCGAGGSLDLSNGALLVCTRVGGTELAIQEGFVNILTAAAVINPVVTPAGTTNPPATSTCSLGPLCFLTDVPLVGPIFGILEGIISFLLGLFGG